LTLWRRLVGAEQIRVVEGMSHLGVLLGEQGNYDEAASLLREALAMQVQLLGDDNPDVAESLDKIGLLNRARGEYHTAASYLGNALDPRVGVLGEDHPDVATTRAQLEDVLARIDP
jgi:tetratricopeptide (TPR) repeat protein